MTASNPNTPARTCAVPGLQPFLRPIARVVIAAHLALVLQPLSAIAQPKGQSAPNPVAEAQLKRYQALSTKISQAQADKLRAALTPTDLLPEYLEQAQRLTKALQAKASNRETAKSAGVQQDVGLQLDWNQLQSTLKSIQGANSQVLAEMVTTGQQLKQRGTAPVILERHAQAERQMQERMAQFERIAAPLLSAANPPPSDTDKSGISPNLSLSPRSITRAEVQAVAPALAELERFLSQNAPAKSHTPIDPKKLPWSAAKATPRMPAETSAEWLKKLPAKTVIKASSGKLAKTAAAKDGRKALTTIAGLQFTDPPSPDEAPTDADLAETVDIQFSPIVRAQAAALGHNPVAIARWVRNNIQWIPTWGSIQGSELTLLNQRGNAIDIASLTMALLRASGIPARYMFGTVDVDAGLVQNWIGDAPSPQVALDLMQQGGIAARGVVSGGRITKIRMEHAWVQAYVNWAPGRGALQGGGNTDPATQYADLLQHPNPNASLNAWIGIDPSYKQYIFSKPIDIAAAVPLNTNALKQATASTINTTEGFIAGLNEPALQAELQRYATQVNAYLDSRPNLTLGDLVKSREVVSDMKQLLAGSSPFPVLASQETSTLPANLRHSVTLKLFATAFDRSQDSPAFTWSTSLPALGIKRLGVTHLPASAADQQTLQSTYASGATSISPYLLNLKPTLQIDGNIVAAAPAMGAGKEQYWSITLTDPSGVNTRTSNSDNTVGDEIVFGVNGNGISPDAVMQRLVEGKPDTAAGNLEQGALHYWLEHDQFDQMIATRLGVLTQRLPSVAIVMAPLTVRYFFGVPRSASYKSRAIDAKQVLTAAAAPNLGLKRQFLLHAGIQGSTVEGSVLDQILSRPEETSVSTTQLFAISARQGLRIYSITQDNAAAVVPRLGTSDAVKQDIQNAIAQGLIAYVPERDITHKGYTGTGYLLLNPDTGEGAYLIDGGRNGGSQPTCEGGAAKPPAGEISVSTILNWQALGPALVGFVDTGAATTAEQAAKKLAAEAISKAAKSAAQRLAVRAGPRMLVAMAVPGANVIMGVALAVAISVEILMLVMEIKMIMADLEIQQLTRTDEDTCECKQKPDDPKCKKCKKVPEPKKPFWHKPPTNGYERRVDWHHQCADNSGNSYAPEEVRIFDKSGQNISVDLFDNSTNTACEVKTSFKKEAYDPGLRKIWQTRIAIQILKQRDIAKSCGWNHCVIVNHQWMADAIREIDASLNIKIYPRCGAKDFVPDPYEQPDPEL